jgi:hypothetical protein
MPKLPDAMVCHILVICNHQFVTLHVPTTRERLDVYVCATLSSLLIGRGLYKFHGQPCISTFASLCER